ncbi:GlsB/YeaQ/YmgE family stress response membrane protein [Bailinhaonella thermotolerans]|uniref:GlsB/YeaQ/YmgE family stress response membrane protein n=1 Tax=Bailinhaonella thermotolerans TaxID=1070861 RepID=A0A3A4ARM7_9ACTN|nr:GlsB/YeaQ/YmgE family stress response membrane protein [Bailinhaonella thermotolerans]RJL22105.1 GlsB/YeaQ/YmgE family stress response membrane protein [Bailinhaonella thermotolerans]
MWNLIWTLIIGFIIGAIGRLIVPGKNAMAWWVMLILGVAGSLIGGYITRAILGGGSFVAFIVSVLVAAALVWAYGAFAARRGSTQ